MLLNIKNKSYNQRKFKNIDYLYRTKQSKTNQMKILKIQFSEEEENQIFNQLITRFDLERSDIWREGQEINFPVNETVECYAKIDLFQDSEIESETNAQIITEQYVGKFTVDFCIDGEEIKVKMIETCNLCLDDRIRNYYRIG